MRMLNKLWAAAKAEWQREMPIPWYLWVVFALMVLSGILAGLGKLLTK